MRMKPDAVTRKAYAKINLTLDVTGRREDGYHLLSSVMQTIGIYDTITVTRENSGEGRGTDAAPAGEGPAPEITLITDDPALPAGEDNLAVRAARLMCGAFSLTDRLTISLDKRIPMAAGMAGGSTDAAAVMLCIRDLYGLDCSLSRLQELAVTLGADIPYCLAGGTKLCEGIGEILTALPDAPQMQVLIAKPEAGASTGGIYRRYDSLPAEVIQHPDTEAMLTAIRANDAGAMARECRNVLEAVTAPEVPQIGRIEEICMEGGALAARMTGSGPTVFALFDDVKKAWKTAELLAGEKELPGLRVYKTGFIYEI